MPVKAHQPRIKKPKLLRSNPHRFTSIKLEGRSPGDVLVDDEDVYVGYRRPELVRDVKVYDADDDLPEDIKWKLFLARQAALAKYREAWT